MAARRGVAVGAAALVLVVAFLLEMQTQTYHHYYHVEAQRVTACSTANTIMSLTPCMNYLTGSTNGSGSPAPTAQCCDAVASVLNMGVECLCQIMTTSNPLGFINRTITLRLPRLCNVTSQPLNQCQENAGVPFTAPAASPELNPAPAPAEFLVPAPAPAESPTAPEPDLAPAAQSPEALTLPTPSTGLNIIPAPHRSSAAAAAAASANPASLISLSIIVGYLLAFIAQFL